MSEYQSPIRIAADDPICSATALNGTIIGILFEKTGSEINGAITKRIRSIDEKISKYEDLIKAAEQFLADKNTEIEELSDYHDERSDLRDEKLEPFNRQIQDIHKKMHDVAFDVDKETEKKIAEKALSFEKGFDSLRDKFKEIDALLKAEDKKNIQTSAELRRQERLANTSNVYLSKSGFQGMSGPTGVTGATGSAVTFDSSDYKDVITEEENRAASRLDTLKCFVKDYTEKVMRIRAQINSLGEEKRRLLLIKGNLIMERGYKLDLNKLSAFGFEDIEVTASA